MFKFFKDKPPAQPTQENQTGQESHSAWAKKRALAYLERGDLQNAIASIISDLSKPGVGRPNPHERSPLPGMLGANLLADPELDEKKVREFIEGFGG